LIGGDRRRARIGLLGGSFNPAHDGHRHVAQLALRALGLDAVWLMVSPGNPLKPARGWPPDQRREIFRKIDRDRRIDRRGRAQRAGFG